jgi:hypothetical protein
MRITTHWAMAAALLTLAGCCPNKPQVWILPVELRSQETYWWCWAASGEMVMDFLGTPVSQCDQANKQNPGTECCSNPVPGACDQPGWPEFKKYGFEVEQRTKKPLSWKELQDELFCEKRPFLFTWEQFGEGSHMMVVRGYGTTDGGARYVYIHDPSPIGVGDSSFISFEEYDSGAFHSHGEDFYQIRKH